MTRLLLRLLTAIYAFLALVTGVHAQSRELPLRIGDQIGIQISGIPPEEVSQISHMYRVSGQGTVNLLYLDDVRAAGVTPSELERTIAQLYKSKEIYTHPNVSITIDTAGTERVAFVSGAVVKPGMVAYRQGLTVAKAISSAGGGTPFAKLSKVELRRGGKLMGVLNLTKATSSDGEIRVEPDDEIIVPD